MKTEAPSPKSLLRAHFARSSNLTGNRPSITAATWLGTEFRCGQSVCRRDDPKHVGRVQAVFNSTTVKVRWNDTGWTSDEEARNLLLTQRD